MNPEFEIMKLCLFVIALSQVAMSQQDSGTIVVLEVTPQFAAIATDSMNTRTCDPPQKPVVTYDVCKVLAFDNSYIFAASGTYDRPESCTSTHTDWSVRTVATDLYKNGNVSGVYDFASKWAVKMVDIFTIEAKRPPLPPRGLDGGVSAAYFVGASQGRITAYLAIIRDPEGKGRYSLDVKEVIADGLINSIGSSGVVAEYLANKTKRSKLWHKNIDGLPPDKQVIEAVKLVERYGPKDKVGGEVDAVTMDSFSMEWKHRKKACENYEQHPH